MEAMKSGRRGWFVGTTAMAGAVLALTTLLAPPAQSKKKFAKKEDKKCSHCHTNPNGGGPRNLTGLYYQATDRLPEADKAKQPEVERVVHKFLDEVAHQTPDLVWRYTPTAELPDAEPPTWMPADDLVVLRRMSLDLRGAPPDVDDLRALKSGAKSLDDILEQYLASQDFIRTFRLYHADLVRPRTGIFNKAASLSRIEEKKTLGMRSYWRSLAVRGEEDRGACESDKVVQVSPYWDRKSTIPVCAESASEERYATGGDGKKVDCATEAGQSSGKCGCGPHLVYCYRKKDRDFVKSSMLKEGERIAMEVVTNDRPYGEILTADWSMYNGRLEHFYARLDGKLGELEDPDVMRPYHRVERDPRHSGILSTHSYLNFFYNGRRWAQRTFESFMCHIVWPDYDFLDEHEDAPPVSYRRHPQAGPNINVNSGRACASCHIQLDGLSRVKDRWDNFGQFYAEEDVPTSTRFLGKEVHDLDAFGKSLSTSPVFNDCVANQAWEHFVGHRFRDDEVRLRRELVQGFADDGQRFKNLLRKIVKSDAYRAKESLKTMERELYWRTMERVTGVKWKVGKKRGFDLFYDKVGGMDYRKIESRDRTPSQGHSLVLYKGAAETCDEAIRRDLSRGPTERKMLSTVDEPSAKPSDEQLDGVLDDWTSRILGRPWSDMSDDDKKLLTSLFREVEKKHSPADGYKAVCTTLFASADFALY
jgi:hypothetical protein